MSLKQQKEQILLGAVEVYMLDIANGTVPTDATIEVDANNVGHTSGGTTVEYMPEKYDVKNSYGETVKSVARGSKATIKFGMLQFHAENVKRLNNAKIEYSVDGEAWTDTFAAATTKFKRLRFDSKYPLGTVLVRLVHTKDDGKKVRTTMFGQGGNGFSTEYSENELVIDAQIDSTKVHDDFIVEIVEEVTPQGA